MALEPAPPPGATTLPSEAPDWFHRFANEIHDMLGALHQRVTQVEDIAGAVKPVAQVAEATIGALAPGAAPIIAQVNEIQSFLGDLLGIFDNHFGGKLNLPTPPTGRLPAGQDQGS